MYKSLNYYCYNGGLSAGIHFAAVMGEIASWIQGWSGSLVRLDSRADHAACTAWSNDATRSYETLDEAVGDQANPQPTVVYGSQTVTCDVQESDFHIMSI